MSVPSEAYQSLASALAVDIVDEVKRVFKDRWDAVQDKDAILRTAHRFAHLILLDKAGYDVSEHKQVVEATLLNWKAAAQIQLYDAFMEAALNIVKLLGAFAGRAARSFVGI